MIFVENNKPSTENLSPETLEELSNGKGDDEDE